MEQSWPSPASHEKNIAAWRSDLGRILQIFDVRLIASFLASLIIHWQSELAIDTANELSDIYRAVKHQGGSNTANPPVSNPYPMLVTESLINPYRFLDSGKVRNLNH